MAIKGGAEGTSAEGQHHKKSEGKKESRGG